MKRSIPFALAFALFATPLFAATKATIDIPNDVSVGSTQIPAGEYKLAYQGSGPVVNVFLSQPGHAPIEFAAKVLPSRNTEVSVTVEKKADGGRSLRYINVGKAILFCDAPEPGDESHGADR